MSDPPKRPGRPPLDSDPSVSELVVASVMDGFIEFLRPRTIVGKFGTGGVPSLRRVPFNVRVSGQFARYAMCVAASKGSTTVAPSKNLPRQPVPARQSPRVRNWSVDRPSVNCSLVGADPPWKWTWGNGGFVAFSDMLPVPSFHSFDDWDT
jgi:hypothetical protein